jgi:hypothetical protein
MDVYRVLEELRGSATTEEIQEFIVELLTGPDRSSAIIGQARLEMSVTKCLAILMPRQDKHVTRLIGDEDRGGELTFSDQCRLLYGLGVIGPKTLSDFLTIARIRNKFGHSARSLKFSSPMIADACESLWAPDHLILPYKIRDLRTSSSERGLRARGRYLYTLYAGFHGLAYELVRRPELAASRIPVWMH